MNLLSQTSRLVRLTDIRNQLLSTGEPRLRLMAAELHFGHFLLFFIGGTSKNYL